MINDADTLFYMQRCCNRNKMASWLLGLLDPHFKLHILWRGRKAGTLGTVQWEQGWALHVHSYIYSKEITSSNHQLNSYEGHCVLCLQQGQNFSVSSVALIKNSVKRPEMKC